MNDYKNIKLIELLLAAQSQGKRIKAVPFKSGD